MRNVHRITISAISRPSQPHLTGGRRSWLVSITSNDTPVHSNLPLHDPFTAEQEDKCRWYLEHYAPLSPFQAEKAKEVSEELLEVYAQELWDQLRLQQIVNLWAEEEGHGEGERGSPLQTIEIDVVDGSELMSDYDPGETVHRLHWEVLEGPALWPAEIVSRVVLRRRVATGSIRIRDVSLWSKATTKSPSFNILLVIARDTNVDRTAFQDVDPSSTSQALFAIEDALDASQAQYRYRLNVEIVRPGTFEAFKEHLKASRKERGDGYFHLVHFDLHGRVAKLKKCDFFYTSCSWYLESLTFCLQCPNSMVAICVLKDTLWDALGHITYRQQRAQGVRYQNRRFERLRICPVSIHSANRAVDDSRF